jgi:hypothetical protein
MNEIPSRVLEEEANTKHGGFSYVPQLVTPSHVPHYIKKASDSIPAVPPALMPET